MDKTIKNLYISSEGKNYASRDTLYSDYYYKNENNDEEINPNLIIKNLSKINLFVGSNNSGKSRFLRTICSLTKYNIELVETKETIHLRQRIVEILEELNNYMNKNNFNMLYKDIKEEDILKGINPKTVLGIIEKLKAVQNFNEEEDFHKILFLYYKNIFSSQEKQWYKESPQLNSLKQILENEEKILDKVSSYPEKGNILGSQTQEIENRKLKDSFSYTKLSAQENKDINDILKNIGPLVKQFCIFEDKNISFKRVYIPILRSLLPISSEDIYANLTEEKYFNNGKSGKMEIFTGLSLYEEIMDLLLGDFDQRENIKQFQEFLSTAFFNNKPVLIIPKKQKNEIHIKIGEEMEYPIWNLGDGIQAIIILTFPIFKYQQENLLLFIEEPESNLHPGMQRKLMEILYTHPAAKNVQFFFTTHSNHLLDMTLDEKNISVYTFNKKLIPNETNKHLAQVEIYNVSDSETKTLQLLGVQNSAVFLTNCTIWVEGITDRLYIKKYLELYQNYLGDNNPAFKEDIHFSFVEYSGNNITHWSFLNDDENALNAEKLCSKLFLITDLDGTKIVDEQKIPKKHQRHEKLKAVLKERYYCLTCREIENLLSENTLKKVIEIYEKDPPNYKKEVKYEDYKNASLGGYIEEILEKSSRKYAAESKTINNKLNFCQKAISCMENFDDLSEEAKKLTEKIYEFIKENNN